VNMTILSFNTESYVTPKKSEVITKFHFLFVGEKSIVGIEKIIL
jgi:hypothetical protein